MNEPNRSPSLLRRRRRDGGAVLITVLLVMIALLGLGITALWLTSSNMQMGANTNMRNMALYVAEMGIEITRQDLNLRTPMDTPTLNGLLGVKTPTPDPLDNVPNAQAPNGPYLGQPWRSTAPAGFAEGAIYRHSTKGSLFNKPFPDPADNIPRTGTIARMGDYTVWIRNDTAELRRNAYTTDGNNTVVVRSLGVAPDGRTSVVLEVTLVPGTTPSGGPPPGNPNAPVLCNSGKNACDDNSSTQAGVVVQ